MPGSAPPLPTFVEVSAQVLYYLGLSTAFGIGMAIAALTIPERQCGEIARRVRRFVLTLVPFLRGSARSEAGGPDAGPFDLQVFGVGLVLVALVASGLWLGTRPSKTVHEVES